MSHRILPLLLAALATPSSAAADGYTPEEAVKRMKLPDGFTVRAVATEPMVRQPVSISFDARGRMWVLQYLQYPNYAGLKPVKQDQYLRTIWDKVPEPPPHGPKGADRVTICYDPDENGVYRKSKDFVTGLNIASGFCIGNGGVYVAQPPYLLYYPDKNEDDVPDGDPEVLLTGFGMDDTHSLANSLQWGPDGWLYGAAGSTSTCKIKNPADPSAPVVEFQQGIWRYHPKTKKFELFSEGGGNTYGLDFDRHGQAIAGTNYGGFACLHQMQGAYYVKGFSKHGPLHNPHTYGYFDHVPYAGFKGGHVTCGGIVYQADAFPPQYRDQYIAANVLSNAVYWHKLEANKSSFKAGHGGDLLEANDPWFRPIDLLQGPDGSVYVVDFYDRRAAHLDPVDNWDRTNGRVYKIEYKGPPKPPAFDLRKKTTAELIELLKHPNKWWRNEARRLLTERTIDEDARFRIRGTLLEWILGDNEAHALEGLWTLHCTGILREQELFLASGSRFDHVRAWAVRLYGDGAGTGRTRLLTLAEKESRPVVLAQLACTAKRLSFEDGKALSLQLLKNSNCADDPLLANLLWWAVENWVSQSPGVAPQEFVPSQVGKSPLVKLTLEKLAHRLASPDVKNGDRLLATLLVAWKDAAPDSVTRGMLQGMAGRWGNGIPAALQGPLATLRKERPDDETLLEVLARMNDGSAIAVYEARACDAKAADAARIKAVDLLKQLRQPATKALFLDQLRAAKSDTLKIGFLGGLEAFDDPTLGEVVLTEYSKWSPAVKKRAVQFLLSRAAWATQLMRQLDAGKFSKADLTVDHAKAAVGLNDKALTTLVEKHFGKLAAATAGEKQARIAWLNVAISRNGPGDPVKGKALFAKHCAACHQLHGEGGKVGPDLTTADRKNRGYLLAQIVDPSGYIRPEFVVHNVVTVDGRKVSGIVEPSTGESVTLVNVVNNQSQKTVIAKADIEAMTPSAVSLMPEKLLDTLTDVEIGHLFAYLAADASKAPAPESPGAPNASAPSAKKLKVCLVSGSFEYKSDESLAAFQKYLEANFPVECTRAFAKAEKDKGFAGLEALDGADVAVFFTRRLRIEGPALERVKRFVQSGKPIVGVRTASHGFQNWLEMDKLVFGGDYQGHFGQGIACDVAVDEKAKGHPVLNGVASFKTSGGLYKNPNVAADVTVLMRGSIPNQSEPVAWVREKDGRRVFYTSLGHPDDFKNPNFIRLLVNGLAWATKSDWKPAK